MNRLFKWVLPPLLSLLLGSCLSVSATLTLDTATTGTLSYSASVSTLAADLEETDGARSIVFFPLLKGKVDAAAAGSGGATIQSWEMTDDGTRYHIKGDIRFATLESLGSFAGIGIESQRVGTDTRLTVTVARGKGETGTDSRIIQIVRDSFPDDVIEIHTIIPGDIIRVQGATFTGSTVNFSISVLDLLQSRDDVRFTVEYR